MQKPVKANLRKTFLRRGIDNLIEQGENLEAILNRLMENVEAQTDKMMAAVFFYDPNSKDLCVGAAPSLQPSYKKAVNGFKIGPEQPACGSAVFKRERVLCHDVRTDRLWKDLLPYAQGANFLACWSEPIFDSSKKVLGTLAFYHPEPKSPDASDIVILETTAEIASHAIQERREQFSQIAKLRKM